MCTIGTATAGFLYSALKTEFGVPANAKTKSGRFKQKQTPWPLVRKRTIPTERPPLVDEI
jgi:hypothetical protein